MSAINKYNYLLHLADNALIIGQRNSDWCGHGPVLEQDIAITNISLDLVGQARSLYRHAAAVYNQDKTLRKDGAEATEDTLAYLRDTRDFKNCLLTEQPNGDWGHTVLRQFLFSSYQYLLYQQLQQSTDSTLAAIAEKSLKEVTYHVRWSGEWVIRLGDGTEESHARMVQAINALQPFTGELFIPAPYEQELVKEDIAADIISLQAPWQQRVQEVLEEATLLNTWEANAKKSSWTQTGGKQGVHTEQLGFILAEMQFMQRAYPGSEW